MTDVLTNLILVIVLQYKHISNNHPVHLKLTQGYISYISVKLENISAMHSRGMNCLFQLSGNILKKKKYIEIPNYNFLENIKQDLIQKDQYFKRLQNLILMEKFSNNRTLLLLSHFSRVRLCVTPQMEAHQAPASLGFSKQEHWSGLPFPSPMHESKK